MYVRSYERVKVEDTRDLLILPEITFNGYRPIEIILSCIPVTSLYIESIVNRYKIDLVITQLCKSIKSSKMFLNYY